MQVRSWGVESGLPHPRIHALAQTDDGFLWLATPRGVVWFDGVEFSPPSDAAALADTEITALGRGSGNRLWLGGADGSVRVLEHGKIHLKWKPTDCAARVDTLEEQPDGGVRMVDSQGRAFIIGATGERETRDHSVSSAAGKPRLHATDGGGRRWESKGDGMLTCHDAEDDGTTTITLRNRRGPLAITALLADRDGTLWVGTDAGGLSQIKPALFRRWDTLVASPAGSGPSAARDSQATSVLIEPRSEGAVVGGPAAVSPYQNANGLGHSVVTDAVIEMLERLPDRQVPARIIIAGPDGGLWVGREGRSALLHYHKGVFHPVALPVESIVIRALAFDTAGTLWIGTAGNGVLRLKNGVVKSLGFPEGTPTTRVCQILPNGSSLWFTTAGSGLLRWKNGSFKAARTTDGLPDDNLVGIQADAFDGLWLSGSKGFFRISHRGLDEWFDGKGSFPQPVVLDGSDGVGRFEGDIDRHTGSSISDDGRIWFAGNGSVIELRPDLFRVPPGPPQAAITECLIDGERVDDPSRIAPGTRRVEFRFTSPQLSHPGGARFECRLAPYESDWVDPGKNRTISYTNLTPGEYQFEVRAMDRYGRWSPQPARLDLRLPAPFWRTRWFLATSVFAALAAAAALVRAIIHARLKPLRERERIEMALAGERRRIARDMHDELGTGLCEIALLGNRLEQETPGNTDAGRLANRSRELVRVIDETVWMLNPRNDTLENLTSYLASSVNQWLRDTPLRPRFELDASFDEVTVPTPVRRHLYLACKELVHNAVKHSGGDELVLAVHAREQGFDISIQDNGRGLPDHPDPTRSGLANLCERVAEIGGTLDIGSAPAGGTRVTLHVATNPAKRAPGRSAGNTH